MGLHSLHESSPGHPRPGERSARTSRAHPSLSVFSSQLETSRSLDMHAGPYPAAPLQARPRRPHMDFSSCEGARVRIPEEAGQNTDFMHEQHTETGSPIRCITVIAGQPVWEGTPPQNADSGGLGGSHHRQDPQPAETLETQLRAPSRADHDYPRRSQAMIHSQDEPGGCTSATPCSPARDRHMEHPNPTFASYGLVSSCDIRGSQRRIGEQAHGPVKGCSSVPAIPQVAGHGAFLLAGGRCVTDGGHFLAGGNHQVLSGRPALVPPAQSLMPVLSERMHNRLGPSLSSMWAAKYPQPAQALGSRQQAAQLVWPGPQGYHAAHVQGPSAWRATPAMPPRMTHQKPVDAQCNGQEVSYGNAEFD